MLSLLLKKDIAVNRKGTGKITVKRVFSLLGLLVFASLIVALIAFMAISVDEKLSAAQSPESAVNVILLFLFLVAMALIVVGAFQFRKFFFNKDDRNILTALPIKSGTIIFAKTIRAYCYQVIETLLLSLPALIPLGIARNADALYYLGSAIYGFVLPLFTLGLSLALSFLIEKVNRLIKDHDFVQFILASVFVVALCFVYSYFLNLFLSSLNNTEIDGSLPPSFVNGLNAVTPHLVPTVPLLNFLSRGQMNVMMASELVSFFLVSWTLGLVIAFPLLPRMMKDNSKGKKERIGKSHILSPFPNLVKKELTLLFKDSSNTFSYTALLIMLPFLTFFVVSSFKGILTKNMGPVVGYFPEVLNVPSLGMILLFVGAISQSASLSMSREGKAISSFKSLPYSPSAVIFAKILVPSALSSLSLIITSLTLLLTSSITMNVFVSSLVAGLSIIVSMNLLGLELDMHDHQPGKMRLAPLTALYSIVLPLVIVLVGFLLQLWQGVKANDIYAIINLISACSLVPPLIGLFFTKGSYRNMEVL